MLFCAAIEHNNDIK